MADEQHLFAEETYKTLARIQLLGLIHNPLFQGNVAVIDSYEWVGINLLMRDDEWNLLNRAFKNTKGKAEFRIPAPPSNGFIAWSECKLTPPSYKWKLPPCSELNDPYHIEEIDEIDEE